MVRKLTKKIYMDGIAIGGGEQITVQSMTNTKTEDVDATVAQILRMQKAGCDIVRVAVPHMQAAEAIAAIKKQIAIPLVADIHFDYRLALAAAEQGADGLRINPGNIGERANVKAVVQMARQKCIPIRIGVNAGSLEKDLLQDGGGKATAHAMVESALRHVHILEEENFFDIKISLKAHDVPMTIAAYRELSGRVEYPLHLGITEAGTIKSGVIKSAVGIGALLAEGIGDTFRISLTGDPVEEVRVGREILKALNLRTYGAELISCPTCGRCNVDLVGMANKVETFLQAIDKPIKVAVMGCIVNGPGEAREADVGIAGGSGKGILFKKGEVIGTYDEEELLERLFAEIKKEV